MLCPFCSADTQVIDARPDSKGYNHFRRRRKCLNEECGIRFTTIEIATIIPRSAKELLRWASKEEQDNG